MFGLLKWRSRRASKVAGPSLLRQVANARMQMEAMGRLPNDVVTGPQAEPTPEYIPETTTPTEEMWAREQARYRAKNGEQPQ